MKKNIDVRVGILTFQWSNNYGAALQAFALKKYLEKNGYEPCIIDYRLSSREKKHVKRGIKDYVLSLLLIPYRKQLKMQKNNFDRFRKKYFNLTVPCRTLQQLEKIDEDFIVCGSDQIWNPKLTGGELERAYFADFQTAAKKIAYAASIGEKHIRKEDEEKYRVLLNNFDHISVRENDMIVEIGKYTNKHISQVLDPTMLLGADDYENLSLSRVINKPYLLIYQNSRNNDVYKIAKQVAKDKGLRIYEVGYRKQFPLTGIPIIQDAGPVEFLSLYRYADFIVTNTFHGTVFAIQFKKDFISIPLKGRESRICSLASKLHFENRLINGFDDVTVTKLSHTPMDYDSIYQRLDLAKGESVMFLKGALK